MGIKAKVKNWWSGLSFGDKVLTIFGATGMLCTLYVTADCIRNMEKVKEEFSNMKVELYLTPKEADEKTLSQNPILGEPVEKRSQFEMATALYNMMDPYNENLQKENGKDIITDEMRQSCLELAWDLAAREGKVEKAEEEGLLPTQVWD